MALESSTVLGVVAVVSTIAGIIDVRTFRVPNLLTISFVVSGMAYHLIANDSIGLPSSLLGALFGFAILFGLYLLGAVGAADVKLMAGVGAWLGAVAAAYVFAVAAAATAVYSIAVLVWRGGLAEAISTIQITFIQLHTMTKHLGAEQRVESIVQRPDRRKHLVPFAAMIALGAIAVLIWTSLSIWNGALTSKEDAVERLAVIPVVPGELLLDAKLASRGAGHGLAPLIPKGMRAHTIQASGVASNVAGFVLPGNRVDVLFTLKGRHNDHTGGGSTTTLLQAVEILAVDQELDAPAENKVNPRDLRSVTLLVTPKQAGLLDLGQYMGRLTLSLRNPDDGEQAETFPTTLADIRFRQEQPFIQSPLGESSSPQSGVEQSLGQQAFEPRILRILTIRGNHGGEVQIVKDK